jgi:PAS domain S-box-containing protein
MVQNKHHQRISAKTASTLTPLPRVSAESVLDLAPDAVVVFDAEGAILHVNRQMERLFGYLRRELLGQFVELLLPARSRDRFRARLTSGDQASPPDTVDALAASLELLGRRHDGSEFPAEITPSRR